MPVLKGYATIDEEYKHNNELYRQPSQKQQCQNRAVTLHLIFQKSTQCYWDFERYLILSFYNQNYVIVSLLGILLVQIT